MKTSQQNASSFLAMARRRNTRVRSFSVFAAITIISLQFLGCNTSPPENNSSNAVPSATLRIEPTPVPLKGSVKPLEVKAEVKPVELRLPQDSAKLEMGMKPLELRLPDKPLKIEGVPDTLKVDWGQKLPPLEVRLPDKIPLLLTEVKDSSGGPANQGNAANPPRGSQIGTPVPGPLEQSLQQIHKDLGNLMTNSTLAASTNQLDKVDKSLRRLSDILSVKSAAMVFGLMGLAGLLGGLMCSYSEWQKKRGALPKEQEAVIAQLNENLQLQNSRVLKDKIPDKSIAAAQSFAKELLSRVTNLKTWQKKINEHFVQKPKQADSTETGRSEVPSDQSKQKPKRADSSEQTETGSSKEPSDQFGDISSYQRNIIKNEMKFLGNKIPWISGFFQRESLERWVLPRVCEGVIAAWIVPGVLFLLQRDVLDAASADWFHMLSLVSLCVIVGMIGGPFINFVREKTLRYFVHSGKKEVSKGGIITISAKDTTAEILVDGKLVGTSPAKMRVPEGMHVIEMKKPGKPDYRYRKEVNVSDGAELLLHAGLESE